MLLGAVVSLYVTVVFERYTRFGELLREVARARQHFEGQAWSTSIEHLRRSHELTVAQFHLLEDKEWSLNADGHHKAAAAVGRLKNFTFRAAACVENMLASKTQGLTLSQYLSVFTSEYGSIQGREFVAFERRLHPSIPALLRPYPHPVMPTAATVTLVTYFDRLL